MARQAAALDEQRQVEVGRAGAQSASRSSSRELEKGNRVALARAEQERVDALATQAAALDEQRQLTWPGQSRSSERKPIVKPRT